MPEGWKDPQLKTCIDQTQDTIFDRLNERGVRWHVYYYDFPSSLLLTHQRRPENLIHYHRIENFYDDCRNEAQFPLFAFIEPKYFLEDQNDDHPPHNIFKGEKLIADVYNGIRSNPDLWNSTLLVVTFDEHGGIYDHVPAPAVNPPDFPPTRIDPCDSSKTFGFDRLGVRVPALLISPWVDKPFVAAQFDHSSFLKLLTEKWNLGPLGPRTANATSLSVALGRSPKADTPGSIRVPYTDLVPPDAALEREDSSAHHKALEAFAYAFALENHDPEAARLASLEPSFWIQGKAWLGKWLLSTGARLSKDFQEFKRSRVEGISKVFETAISRSEERRH
jgi:phospholipase C